MLLRMLVARLGSVDDANDAMQDVWLKLVGMSPEPIASPAGYLFRMAHNVALDRRRTALSRSAREAQWLEAQPTAQERPDAEAVLLARERLQHVEAALAALPDQVGQAFRMFRLEGLAQKAIAQSMDLSLSQVEKLLQRAYRRIHDAGRENSAGRDVRQRHHPKEVSR